MTAETIPVVIRPLGWLKDFYIPAIEDPQSYCM